MFSLGPIGKAGLETHAKHLLYFYWGAQGKVLFLLFFHGSTISPKQDHTCGKIF